MAPVLGGIEAGGTRWRCAVGAGPGDLSAEATIAATTPAETLAAAVAFFEREGPVDALGAGSFGPVDLKRGGITTTPKPGWADTDVAGELVRRLGVPVAFDTDVNAAVLGEHRWGAAQGFDTCCYITVGTGIGGGAIVGGRLLHGLVHPELGHIRIPHDRTADPFRGACPYHGDCWEGLASGAALEARWGRPPETIEDVAAWALEARYLALGLVAVIAVLSPERIVLGGGVMSRAGLLELVREDVDRLLSGYVAAAEIVPSAVGACSARSPWPPRPLRCQTRKRKSNGFRAELSFRLHLRDFSSVITASDAVTKARYRARSLGTTRAVISSRSRAGSPPTSAATSSRPCQ